MIITEDQMKAHATALKDKQTRKQLRILVVEDQLLLQKLLHEVLKDQNTFDAASTVSEGWEKYIATAPDIVFMDIGLPDGDGHTLAQDIKGLDSTAYIVMVTSSDDDDDMQRAAKNHVNGFITKPFNRQMIQDCIRDYMMKFKPAVPV